MLAYRSWNVKQKKDGRLYLIGKVVPYTWLPGENTAQNYRRIRNKYTGSTISPRKLSTIKAGFYGLNSPPKSGWIGIAEIWGRGFIQGELGVRGYKTKVVAFYFPQCIDPECGKLAEVGGIFPLQQMFPTASSKSKIIHRTI